MIRPRPPLASKYWPVTQPESGEASRAAAAAMSSTVPIRPRAVIAEKAGSTFGFARISALTALGRIGTVEDVAAAAALLASPDSGWVTGQYFEASGGLGLVVPGFGTN